LVLSLTYEAGSAGNWSRRLGEESLRAGLALLALVTLFAVRSLPAQSVRGQVMDQAASTPVAGTAVTLLDSAGFVVAEQATGTDGRFALSAPGPGRYRLRFQVPGYNLLVTSLFDLAAGQELDYPLTLQAIPPTVLDTLLVEGHPIPWNLTDFYRRKRHGFGNFATRADWEKWAAIGVEDVIRHINPFVSLPNAGRGVQLYGRCTPAVFLDNLPLAPDYDLTNLFLEGIAAVEVYRAPYVPPEFERPFGVCAAIAIWSRVDMPGTERRIALGLRVGGALAGAGGWQGRVGVHALIGFEGPFELYPAVNVLGSFPGAGSTAGSGWEIVFAVRVRPLGPTTGWYLGLGGRMTAIKATDTQPAADQQGPVLLSGWEFKLGGARPFVELELLDPQHPGAAVVNAMVGVSARIY
jgi:hypothetical protein